MRVSEIRVKRIRVNQGLGVSLIFIPKKETHTVKLHAVDRSTIQF